MDFAEALRKCTAEESAKPVCEYIVGLGKCGKGLTDALPSTGIIGRIFGERAGTYLHASAAHHGNPSSWMLSNAFASAPGRMLAHERRAPKCAACVRSTHIGMLMATGPRPAVAGCLCRRGLQAAWHRMRRAREHRQHREAGLDGAGCAAHARPGRCGCTSLL